MSQRTFGGTLTFWLLLILFLLAAVAFWTWKGGYGVIGHTEPIKFDSKDHILFLRHSADGHTDLMVVKSDGTSEKALTDDLQPKQGATWSPDGKQICYSGEVNDGGTKAFQLFMLGSSGARQATAGTGSKLDPQWSPDGKQIAFLVGGALKVIEPNGDNVEQIYPHAHKGGSEESGDKDGGNASKTPPINNFAWSPDSRLMAGLTVMEGETAQVMGQSNWWQKKSNADDSESAPTVSEAEMMIVLPAGEGQTHPHQTLNSERVTFGWMPDSKRMLVSSKDRANVQVMSIATAEEERIAPTAIIACAPNTVEIDNPDVSPDGANVVFELWDKSTKNARELVGLVIMPILPSQLYRVTTVKDIPHFPVKVRAKATNPKWSSDGKHILYSVTNTDGKRDIWVVDGSGANALNLTKGKGDNLAASWSPAK